MIWAGRTYLIHKTGYKKEELNCMPYPEFKAMIEYYGDPEGFLQPSVQSMDYESVVERYERMNQEMIDRVKKNTSQSEM